MLAPFGSEHPRGNSGTSREQHLPGLQREGTWKERNLAASKRDAPSTTSQHILLSKPFFLGTGSGIPFSFTKRTQTTSLKAGRKALSLIYAFWTEKTPCIYMWVYTCASIFVFNVAAAMKGGCGQFRAWKVWMIKNCLFAPESLPGAIHKDSIPRNSFKRPIYCREHQNSQL